MADGHIFFTNDAVHVHDQTPAEPAPEDRAETPGKPEDAVERRARDEYFADGADEHSEANLSGAALLAYYQMQASGLLDKKKNKALKEDNDKSKGRS